MQTFETLLPSGRAVRYREISVEALQKAERRAGEAVGKAPDPGGVRFSQARLRELVAAALVAVAGPVQFVRRPSDPDDPSSKTVVDVDATLDAIGPEQWTNVTPLDLEKKGSLNFFELFGRVADLSAFEAHIAETMVAHDEIEVAAQLAGKARARASE